MDFLTDDRWMFAGMVFIAVFLLAQTFIVPAFGENRRLRKQIGRRLRDLTAAAEQVEGPSLLRRPDRRGERWIAQLPGGEWFLRSLAQAGKQTAPGRVLGAWLAIGVLAGAIVGWLMDDWLFGVAGTAVALLVLVIRLNAQRNARINLFEAQLQDAFGIMIRALRAGHPFTEALRLVSTELPAPAGPEFGMVFAEVNYGGDLRRALLGLLARVPSVTVMAMITAVLIQRETGGNLAETLDKINAVVRGRFRFQRRVQTLSAEAKLSAWVLGLVPFVLFLAISFVNPEYLPLLVDDPVGRQLVMGAFLLMVVGILWMRRIMRIRV